MKWHPALSVVSDKIKFEHPEALSVKKLYLWSSGSEDCDPFVIQINIIFKYILLILVLFFIPSLLNLRNRKSVLKTDYVFFLHIIKTK